MSATFSAENAIVKLQAKVDHLERDVTEMKADIKQIQKSVTDISIAIARSEESMKNTARTFGLQFTVGMIILSGLISLAVKYLAP